MIKIRLAKLMKKKGISRNELARITGIRAHTLTTYCQHKVKRMNVRDLIKMCEALNCTLSELIEYIPESRK